MYIAIFVIAIILAILIHEAGHFATAKAFGMRVEKFFAGFGPTLWSVRPGETEYGVKAIPAGGFVKIAGMSPYEELDPESRGRRFYEKPAWQRAIVLAAGSVTHFVVAVILLFGALWLYGAPSDAIPARIGAVTSGAPAEQAGVQAGDLIVAIDGVAVDDFREVHDLVGPRGGEDVAITVLRDGSELTLGATLTERTVEGERRGFLGVEVDLRRQFESMPPGDALRETFVGDLSIVRLTELTVVGLGQAFSPEGLSQWVGQLGRDGPREPAGPVSLVGAGQIAGALGEQGDVFGFLLILISINIVIGLLNLLPLPPLDGGHLAVLATERVVNGVRRLTGKEGYWRPDPARLTPIALAVILFFGMVFVTALFIDLVRPASELLQ